MLKGLPARTWATPLTIGSFVLMSGTGVLMFFGLDAGLTSGVHRLFSWLFLLGAGAHVVVNVRAFKKHLNSRWGRSLLGASLVVLAASLSNWGIVTDRQVLGPVEQDLISAPLSTLASLTHTTPDTLVSRMKAKGMTATSQQSIHDVAGANHVSEDSLIALVFLPR